MEPRQALLPRVLCAATPRARQPCPGRARLPTHGALHPRGSASAVPRDFAAGGALISKPQLMSWAKDMPPSVQEIHAPETRCRANPARRVAWPPGPARGGAWAGPGGRRGHGARAGPAPGHMARRLVQGRRAGSGPSHLPLVIIGLGTRGCIRGTDPRLRGRPAASLGQRPRWPLMQAPKTLGRG